LEADRLVRGLILSRIIYALGGGGGEVLVVLNEKAKEKKEKNHSPVRHHQINSS